jgi:glycosyltransferase 2 family protein
LSHKQNLKLLVGVLLAAGLLALFLRGIDWPLLKEAFAHARIPYLVAFVALTIASFVIRSWRWGYLLRPLARVPFVPLFSATYV